MSAGSLDSPHTAPMYTAPDSPQRPDPRACGACVKCHPGRQFGRDEKCRNKACTCHRTPEPDWFDVMQHAALRHDWETVEKFQREHDEWRDSR